MKNFYTHNVYEVYFKRIIDVVLSGISIATLSPFLLVIAIAIKIDSPGPVLFIQDRVGKYKVPFKMFKFRTMLTFENSYYPNGKQIANYDRITKIGKILRKTSLDELPQLINILIGDMSLVGPRPTLSYQVEKYDQTEMKRLNVKPGLTGLAQICGRNGISWEKKILFDLQYIKSISFLRDARIILKTFSVVLQSEGVEFIHADDISQHIGDLFDDIGGSSAKK